jgi:hypothetical protein
MGAPQTGQPLPDATSALPLECSSTAYEDKNLNRMLGRFDHTTHGIPSGLYKQPLDPNGRGESGSHLFIHQIKSSCQRYYTLETPYTKSS